MKYEGDTYQVDYAAIQDVEVTREGNWNGRDYGKEFFDDISATYDPEMLRGKLIQDHQYGGPAYGHVLALNVEDDPSAEGAFRLIATIGFLPEGLAMVESGQWNERSIGWATFHPTPGFPYLWEVSLLGANTPAAVGMAPIIFEEENSEDMMRQLAVDQANGELAAEAIAKQLAWDKTDEYIRHRLRNLSRFRAKTLRTIELDVDKGILAIAGKLQPKYVPEGGSSDSMVLQSVMFELEMGWTLKKAKAWIGKRDLATMNVTISGAVPFHDFAVADAEPDADADRFRQLYAGGEDINWDVYRQFFLWYNTDDKENLESYKLPIADVVNGEIKAISGSIAAAAEALGKTSNEIEVGLVVQAKAGGPKMTVSEMIDGDVRCQWFEGDNLKEGAFDIKELNIDEAVIPEADIPGVKSHLEKYYDKMDRKAPWQEDTSGNADDAAQAPDLTILKSNEGGTAMPETGVKEETGTVIVREVGSTEDLDKKATEMRELKERREAEAQERLRKECEELSEKAELAREQSIRSAVRTMQAEGYITGAQVEMGLAEALAAIPDIDIVIGDKKRNAIDIIKDALKYGGKLKLKLEIAKDILSDDPGDPLIKARAHGIDTSVEERRIQLMKENPKMSHADALDKATREVKK